MYVCMMYVCVYVCVRENVGKKKEVNIIHRYKHLFLCRAFYEEKDKKSNKSENITEQIY